MDIRQSTINDLVFQVARAAGAASRSGNNTSIDVQTGDLFVCICFAQSYTKTIDLQNDEHAITKLKSCLNDVNGFISATPEVLGVAS